MCMDNNASFHSSALVFHALQMGRQVGLLNSDDLFCMNMFSRRGPPPEWENSHRGEWGDKEVVHTMPHAMPPLEEEWGCFPGAGGDWVPSADRRVGWVDDWSDRQGMGLGPPPGRPPPRMMQPHREEPASHLVTREVKMDDTPHEDM